jgi:hypothetical protein
MVRRFVIRQFPIDETELGRSDRLEIVFEFLEMSLENGSQLGYA